MSQTERIKKEYEKSLVLFRSGSTLPKQARLDALTRLDVAMRRRRQFWRHYLLISTNLFTKVI